jgi:hypothetical protein
MNWYTVEALQEMANQRNKPICAWRPKGVSSAILEGRWIHDHSGRVGDYRNTHPDLNETDPWGTKHSYKRLFRPQGE